MPGRAPAIFADFDDWCIVGTSGRTYSRRSECAAAAPIRRGHRDSAGGSGGRRGF
jgi:hypothetical protein